MTQLTLDLAQKIVGQATALAAEKFGRPICVSVCDPAGFLILFVRMEGAPLRTIEIAQRKAYTAARMGISTKAFLTRLEQEKLEIGNFCDSLFTALPGGHLITTTDGQVLGAIGVSGLALVEDEAVAASVARLA